MTAPTLRPYQVEALEAILHHYREKRNRLLVKMPTGTGKTVMFAEMLKYLEQHVEVMLPDYKHRKGARMLVIAHREELLDQAAEKIGKANPGLMISIEQGDRHANRYSDVVIASIQTLAAMKFRRLKRLLAWHNFRLVIVDEAHHAAAASYRTALVYLGFLPPSDSSDREELEAADFDDVALMEKALEGWDAVALKDRLLVGVTATPNRSDAIGLGCVFQAIAYSLELKVAIDAGYLVPITPWVIETASSLDDVRTTAGDFNQKDLAIAVNNDKRNQLAVAGWQEKAPNIPTIAFTVDVAHAHDLAAEFEAAGIPARPVSGETPREDRRQILEALRNRRIDVVTNCMVLTEGTDLPIVGCILHAKPTKSATLYEQMTGRGLRPFPDKTECLVLDLVDIARKHTLQAAPVLYGLPPGLKTEGKDLRGTAADLEAFLDKNPGFDLDAALKAGRLTLEQLAARATTFNVWSIPSLGPVGEILGMNWILAGKETYQLKYPWQNGQETLVVQRDMLGQFELASSYRETPTAPGLHLPTRQRTMASGLETAAEALRLAETFVEQERRGVNRLKSKTAPWRDRPASEKQIALLKRRNVPIRKGLTMGQASDLLDVAFARGRR